MPTLPDRPVRSLGTDAETAARRRSRRILAAVMVGAGALHFVVPGAYARIVPRALGDARTVVYVSGVAEVLCGLLLGNHRTRRVGGWCTAVVLVAVFPANVKMALDHGSASGPATLGPSVLAWLRLPLQVPLIAWALTHARRP